jgi:hypothetical protein
MHLLLCVFLYALNQGCSAVKNETFGKVLVILGEPMQAHLMDIVDLDFRAAGLA